MSGPRIDQAGVYPSVREIDPTLVARIAGGYGAQAAWERWHWINRHDLADLATERRCLMRDGKKWDGPKPARRRGPAPGWARARQAVAAVAGPGV